MSEEKVVEKKIPARTVLFRTVMIGLAVWVGLTYLKGYTSNRRSSAPQQQQQQQYQQPQYEGYSGWPAAAYETPPGSGMLDGYTEWSGEDQRQQANQNAAYQRMQNAARMEKERVRLEAEIYKLRMEKSKLQQNVYPPLE